MAAWEQDTNRDGLISSDEAPAWPYGLSVQDLTSSDAQTLFTTVTSTSSQPCARPRQPASRYLYFSKVVDTHQSGARQ